MSAHESLTVKRVRGAEELATWQRFVARRYLAHGFVAEDECVDGRIQDVYDQRSLHFLLCQASSHEIEGAFRMVMYSSAGKFPMEDLFDLSLRHHELPRLFEVTRVISKQKGGFLRESGSTGAKKSIFFFTLCYSMAHALYNNKLGFLVMIDPIMFARFNFFFANIMCPLQGLEPRYYQGGWLIPAQLRLDDFESKVLAQNDGVRTYFDHILASDVAA